MAEGFTAADVTMPCAACAGRMRHVGTIPAVRELPALHTFQCEECRCFKTLDKLPAIEADKAAA